MTRNAFPTSLSAVLLLAAFVAGCSKEYQHKELGPDSPTAARINEQVESLRKVASDEAALKAAARDQLAPGLSKDAADRTEDALCKLAKAKDAKLVRLDRFGKALRAGFSVTDPESGQAIESFFVLTDDPKPRWIKTN